MTCSRIRVVEVDYAVETEPVSSSLVMAVVDVQGIERSLPQAGGESSAPGHPQSPLSSL